MDQLALLDGFGPDGGHGDAVALVGSAEGVLDVARAEGAPRGPQAGALPGPRLTLDDNVRADGAERSVPTNTKGGRTGAVVIAPAQRVVSSQGSRHVVRVFSWLRRGHKDGLRPHSHLAHPVPHPHATVHHARRFGKAPGGFGGNGRSIPPQARMLLGQTLNIDAVEG